MKFILVKEMMHHMPHEMYKTLQMMGMTKLNWSRNSAMNCRELPDGNPDFFRNSEEFLGLPNLCMFVIVCTVM